MATGPKILLEVTKTDFQYFLNILSDYRQVKRKESNILNIQPGGTLDEFMKMMSQPK